jgi:hypothetical protein
MEALLLEDGKYVGMKMTAKGQQEYAKLHAIHLHEKVSLYTTTTLPLSNLPLLRQCRTNDLIAVEQAKRIESLLELSHCINGTLAYFMW